MKRPPRRRERACDPGRTRVTNRDLDILGFIGTARVVRTSHVARLFGMSFDVARRRLRVLLRHGLVRVIVEALDEENEVVLSPHGRQMLVDAGADGALLATPRGLGGFHRGHHAAGVSFHVSLRCFLKHSTLVLARYAFEHELRQRVGNARDATVPDAAFVLDGPGGRMSFALEIDMGSERPRWVAKDKGAYAALRAAGQPLLGEPDWSVLFIVPDDRRVAALAAAFLEAGIDMSMFFFANMSALSAGIITSGWHRITIDEARNEARLVVGDPFKAVLTARPGRDDGGDDARA